MPTIAGSHELRKMKDLLEEIGWEPEITDSGDGFFVKLSHVDPLLAFAYIGLNKYDKKLNCTVSFSIPAPVGRRHECASLFMAMNWHLATGNFQIDLEDGQLRYKGGINLSSATFQEILFKNLVVDALLSIDMHKGLITRFITENLTLKEAIMSLKMMIAESRHEDDKSQA